MVCGWLLACDAGALTLGRIRGAVLVGRPLSLSVPVTLDRAGDDACPVGEVYYGQSRVERASLRWEPGTGDQGVVRVVSALPVDEPSVSIDLRIGCGPSSTRHYVLLADLPPANEAVLPLVAAAPATAPWPAVPGRDLVAGAPPGRSPRAAAIAHLAAVPAAPVVAVKPAKPAKPKPQPAAPVRPRLQLEPLDLAAIDGPSVLRLTTELGSLPAADPQRRAEAAALWAALQETPEEAAQDAQRLQALRRELEVVREATRQNAQAAARMRAEVEHARAQRGQAGWLAGALTALLAALVAWIGWRGWRTARIEKVNRWFEAHGEAAVHPPARDTEPASTGPGFLASVPDTSPGVLPIGAAAATALPLAAQGETRSAPAPSVARGAAPAASAPFAAKTPAPPARSAFDGEEFPPSSMLRMVGVEELIDVQDQVDFFLSIGQAGQAIALLEAHVHDQVETSALPWLDLLELYHAQGRRFDFERLRGEFRRHFTAQVPNFEQFGEPTPPLEHHSKALSRIVALWPSHRVLDVIEESIFRKPGLPGAEPFGLEAYRELVLLYHVAREVAPPAEPRAEAPRRTNSSETSLPALNTLDRPEPGTIDHDRLLVPPASAGVDIDLADAGTDEPVVATGARELSVLDFDIDGLGLVAVRDPADSLDPKAK